MQQVCFSKTRDGYVKQGQQQQGILRRATAQCTQNNIFYPPTRLCIQRQSASQWRPCTVDEGDERARRAESISFVGNSDELQSCDPGTRGEIIGRGFPRNYYVSNVSASCSKSKSMFRTKKLASSVSLIFF